MRYSLDGGVTYPYVLERDLLLTGTFNWSLPPNLNTTDLRIRAELRNGAGNTLTSDESDANITIDTNDAVLPPPVSGIRAASTGATTATGRRPRPPERSPRSRRAARTPAASTRTVTSNVGATTAPVRRAPFRPDRFTKWEPVATTAVP